MTRSTAASNNRFDFFENPYLTPEKQLIDQYGKLRGIVAEEGGIYTQPLPPLDVPLIDDLEELRNEFDDIANIIHDWDLEPIKQYVIDDKLEGIESLY